MHDKLKPLTWDNGNNKGEICREKEELCLMMILKHTNFRRLMISLPTERYFSQKTPAT